MEATTNNTERQQQQQHSHTKLQLELEPTEETPQASATATATAAIIIDIPAAAAASCHLTASSACSSYDTDCSTASSTCCTRQGEQIYMQKPSVPSSVAVAATAMAPTTATTTTATAAATATVCNMQHSGEVDELVMLKFEHRKHWPWFILLISIIEVSLSIFACFNFTRSLFQFHLFHITNPLISSSLALSALFTHIPCSKTKHSFSNSSVPIPVVLQFTPLVPRFDTMRS